ncbi:MULTISPECIES: ABC transporter permease [Limnochorda]|uniref:ABC transporter permease n=1 Tax=Limnochorda TaxID=1676651 RepID=UPI0017CBDAF6|nr:ABC transporter permease [Limnochorda pilosa]MBO2486430.1 peptide ABC transporter permease [Bacillota bacterium]MBO2520017.1 peptide ABC transporter permease [Bacillota bacterium]NMA71274.1 ABC transporter permease [Bacillota bacterium]
MAVNDHALEGVQPQPVAGHLPKSRSPWAQAWRRFRRSRSGMVGLAMVGFLVVMSLLAPIIAPYDPSTDRNLRARLNPPSWEHPMGTDELGRDILNRVWHGTGISLRVGLLAVSIGLVIGSFLGLLAGYLGRWVDTMIGWLTDILLAFPSVLLAIFIVAAMGPGIFNTIIAVGVVQIPIYTRLTRSMVLSLREQEWVLATQALGAGHLRTLFRHILPNGLTPVIVQATLSLGTAILDAAALGFLGLGAQPPAPEWGLMIARGFAYFAVAPWISLFPGLAIIFAVVAFNLLGDGLRDALDPRANR